MKEVLASELPEVMRLLGAEQAHGLEKDHVRQTSHMRRIVTCGCVVRRPFGLQM